MTVRAPQLAYSEVQPATFDEPKRRTKAAKIRAVLQHFLGVEDLSGTVVLDLGCSTGFTADELRRAGATVVGSDIDTGGLVFAAGLAPEVSFLAAEGSALPFPDASLDAVVFNHIYEHVVDADAVIAEIRRVLRPDGVVYLGLGNKYVLVEPHYRLPLLSWLPRGLADRYMRVAQRGSTYYEQFRTRRQLLQMCAGLRLWEYTYTVLCDPDAFHARDMVPPSLSGVPASVWRAVQPVMPTFIWVGTPGGRTPGGRPTRSAPRPVGAGARP